MRNTSFALLCLTVAVLFSLAGCANADETNRIKNLKDWAVDYSCNYHKLAYENKITFDVLSVLADAVARKYGFKDRLDAIAKMKNMVNKRKINSEETRQLIIKACDYDIGTEE